MTMSLDVTVIGEIEKIETFAIGRRIRELKRKGLATVRLVDGFVAQAELHWYEAAGIGRRELKIKRYLD